MEKRYYNRESLERSLSSLERKFGMSSRDFYERVSSGDRVEGMPNFTRSVWASFYRDFCRLSGDEFAVTVDKTLELA
jgi:hypothetical protein